MNNDSKIFKVVISIAVVGLYVWQIFLCNGNCKSDKSCKKSTKDTNTTAMVIPVQAKDLKASRIVFVNSDTLLRNYESVKDLKKEAEYKQSKLEGTYKDKAQKLQRDYAELQQKASQGALSSDQAKVAEADIMKRKQELDGMEKQLSELAEEMQHKTFGIQEKINKFLKEYNKNGYYQYILSYSSNGGSVLLGGDSLDITQEVLNGLNAQYRMNKKK